MGRKLSTLPTPVNTPSTTSERTASFTSQEIKALFTSSVSRAMPSSSRPCSHAPMTLKVRKNTSPIMPIKAGMAVYFPVRKRSILWLRRCSRLSWGFTTVASTSS